MPPPFGLAEPDLCDVPRTWKMVITYKGLDSRMVTKNYVVREKEHANENLMRLILKSCLNSKKEGWEIPSHHVQMHFEFDDMPPAGAKVISFERVEDETTEVREKSS